MTTLVSRRSEALLGELARGLRIVVINGPRQSGKTTLLSEYHARHGGTFVSLDNQASLTAAIDDPLGFAAQGPPPLLIDEVQRGGDALVRAIKLAVDADRARGQFILSGSSRFLTIPTLSESLAGRTGFLDLWPLSLAELTGGDSSFLVTVSHNPEALVQPSPWSRQDYLERIVQGGYPELLTVDSPVVRSSWYSGYLTTVITRDISDFAEVHRVGGLSGLLGVVAARSGTPAVLSDLARATDLGRDTVRNYLSYLHMVFLTAEIPVWSTNLTTRQSKTPRLYVTDSGLAAHLLQTSLEDLATPGHPALGALLETFVLAELTKLKAMNLERCEIYHYRDNNDREIDFILEWPGGQVIAIEVKASMSPRPQAAAHLRWLRDRLRERFTAGIVVHLGQTAHSHGDRIYSLPLSTLWGHAL